MDIKKTLTEDVIRFTKWHQALGMLIIQYDLIGWTDAVAIHILTKASSTCQVVDQGILWSRGMIYCYPIEFDRSYVEEIHAF